MIACHPGGPCDGGDGWDTAGSGGRTLATNRDRFEHPVLTETPAELWSPGGDLDQHHPGLRDPRLRTASAKGRPLVVGRRGGEPHEGR